MEIYQNYLNVVKKISTVTQKKVTIVPVSKYSNVEQMNELYSNGIKVFGESRVETFQQKYNHFPDSSWHMIGSIQSRKVKDLVGNFQLIHSLDREKLALEIDKRSMEQDIVSKCLVQVNVSKEESKSGLYESEVEDFIDFTTTLKSVEIKGLMTMAPFTENPEEVRYVFNSLRALRDRLQSKGFSNIKELSMGMSNDYMVAVEEGATIVRVGSEIFG